LDFPERWEKFNPPGYGEIEVVQILGRLKGRIRYDNPKDCAPTCLVCSVLGSIYTWHTWWFITLDAAKDSENIKRMETPEDLGYQY
jgi:hypothetical protein